jgi:hypothetical protein
VIDPNSYLKVHAIEHKTHGEVRVVNAHGVVVLQSIGAHAFAAVKNMRRYIDGVIEHRKEQKNV